MKSSVNYRTYRSVVWAIFAAVVLLSLRVGAGAVEGEKKIRLLDDCDPVTFTAAFGENTCIGNGHTTLDEFFEELEATQDVHKWKNQPSEVQIQAGRQAEVENRGGEPHTFTHVAEFGGGLLEDLNELSGNPIPAPECFDFANIFNVRRGDVRILPLLPVGTHKFQCCLHPWMRTVIEVR